MFLMMDFESGDHERYFCFNLASFPSVYWCNTLRTCTKTGMGPKYRWGKVQCSMNEHEDFSFHCFVAVWDSSLRLFVIQKPYTVHMTKCSCLMNVISFRKSYNP